MRDKISRRPNPVFRFQTFFYKSIPSNIECDPNCTASPLPELEVTLNNLEAGQDYQFEFWVQSNGDLSDVTRKRQSTFPDKFTTASATETLERQATLEVDIESGYGSRIVFSYTAVLSGLTHRYEKNFELVSFIY